MRCLCSGKSKSYIVTTLKTPVQSKISTQNVVASNVQNGTSETGVNGQAPTTTTPINDIDIAKTTSTEVQLHNNDVTRYNDTAKTVAREFTDLSTSKSSTPEGTLRKKPKAPQPVTSQSHVITHNNLGKEILKTLESQGSSPKTLGNKVTFKSPIESQLEISKNSSESQVTTHKIIESHVTSPKTSEIQVTSPIIVNQKILDSQLVNQNNTTENQLNSYTNSDSHIISPTISKTLDSHVNSFNASEHHVIAHESSHTITVRASQETSSSSALNDFKSEASLVVTEPIAEEIHSSTVTGSKLETSLVTMPVEKEIKYTSSTVSDPKSETSSSTTQKAVVSIGSKLKTSRNITAHTSQTLTSSQSETSLLTVPSSADTLSKSPSVSSFVEITTSTTDLSSESVNLIGRKESVGELIAGSNRSSGLLEEHEVRRRSGVQVSVLKGPEVTSEEELPVFKKSPEDEEKIRKAIEKNEFLSKILSGKRLQDIINAMQPKNVIAKQKLVKQGEKGSEMFVSKEGTFKVLIKGKVVGEFKDSRVFGELAILYNAKRLASIQAASTGKVWVLDRHVYQKIVISSNLKEQDENLKFLQDVKSLNVVHVEVLRQVSNLLKPEFFVSGTVIIRQGDKGDKFYIIRAGTVTISKTGEGILGTLGKGKCFGEMALQKEDTRQATVTAEAPGVECLTLTRADFINHFGDVEIPKIEVKKTSFKDDAPSEYQDIKLEDLKIIKTLGVGGFGRVELVQHKKKKDLIFALKYLKKIDIVYQNQQEHVYNEKLIQMNSRSPFIVRLYRTYKDNKYVYFLMESCLGGDLFSLLHKQKGKRFEEKDARFLSACVLEALEHLHSKGIVYRDLKPENLLIDKNGYLKLTDFGFAKKMPARGKTFTFAGTPEYVAPEIVLNRGHDKAVDYWAFGSFIFELLTGRTPFRTGDSSHMRTYNKILNGIDNVNFPTYMNPKARNLIEKLCRPVPAERLGMQRGGTRDIKAHKWYQGFEWIKFQQCQIHSSFKPKLKDQTDTSNFDLFKQDKDYPPDETSGWDIHF